MSFDKALVLSVAESTYYSAIALVLDYFSSAQLGVELGRFPEEVAVEIQQGLFEELEKHFAEKKAEVLGHILVARAAKAAANTTQGNKDDKPN